MRRDGLVGLGLFWERLLREKQNCFSHLGISISVLAVTIVGPCLIKIIVLSVSFSDNFIKT